MNRKTAIIVVALTIASMGSASAQTVQEPPHPHIVTSLEIGYGGTESGFSIQNATTFDVSIDVEQEQSDGSWQWNADGDLEPDGGALAVGSSVGTYRVFFTFHQDNTRETNYFTVVSAQDTLLTVTW